MSIRRHIMMGVGFAALTSAGIGVYTAQRAAPALDDNHIVVVDGTGAAAVAEADESPEAADPHLLAPAHKKWALSLALGAVLSGLAGLIGFNGLLNSLARSGQAAAKAAIAVAKAPARAAKTAAVAVAKTVKKPGQYLLGASLVTVCLVATVALLDIQWKAGLLVGAGAAVAGMLGWSRLTGRKQDVATEDAALFV